MARRSVREHVRNTQPRTGAMQWVIGTLVVLPLVLCAGCQRVSLQRATAFDRSVSIVGDSVIDGFAQLELEHLELEIDRLLKQYAENPAAANPTAVRSLVGAEHLAARVQIINGLRSYSQGLVELLGDNQLEQFDNETRELGRALASSDLVTTQAGLSESDTRLLALAVNALGRQIIEYRRQRSVRELIEQTDNSVQRISTLLAKDLEAIAIALDQTLIQRRSTLNDLLIRDFAALQPEDQRTRVGELVELETQRRAAQAGFEASVKAMKGLGDAHAKMLDEDEADFDSIVKEAIAEGRRAERFYKTLLDE